MKTKLTYKHTRDLFIHSVFKPFVYFYFDDVVYEGTKCGNWYPSITISNWDEIKDTLPKYAIPESYETT